MQALVKDGHNADEYIFDGKMKDEVTQEQNPESNVSSHLLFFYLKICSFLKSYQCDSNSDIHHIKTELNCVEDTSATDVVIKTENPCVKTIETFTNQVKIGCDNDKDIEHLELTGIDSDKLDTSNVDNEDSLNLTIGEEEAKIFQDEVINNDIENN